MVRSRRQFDHMKHLNPDLNFQLVEINTTIDLDPVEKNEVIIKEYERLGMFNKEEILGSG